MNLLESTVNTALQCGSLISVQHFKAVSLYKRLCQSCPWGSVLCAQVCFRMCVCRCEYVSGIKLQWAPWLQLPLIWANQWNATLADSWQFLLTHCHWMLMQSRTDSISKVLSIFFGFILHFGQRLSGKYWMKILLCASRDSLPIWHKPMRQCRQWGDSHRNLKSNVTLWSPCLLWVCFPLLIVLPHIPVYYLPCLLAEVFVSKGETTLFIHKTHNPIKPKVMP